VPIDPIETVIFGVGHLAKFILPLFNEKEVFGLSRTFSVEIPNKSKYLLGEEIPLNTPRSPKIVIWNTPPREGLLSSLKFADLYFEKDVTFIFVSSTSMYKSGLVNENSPPNPLSKVYPYEQFVQSIKRPFIILRPAGLIDDKRHPSKFFKKNLLPNSDHVVNLVHCHDLARFIHFIKDHKAPKIINIVSNQHPTKKEFYSAARASRNFPPLKMQKSEQPGKVVSNELSLKLGFKYLYNDLFKFIENAS